MVNYKCIRCGYETNHKSKMYSHLERKKVCKPLLNNVNLDDYKSRILECENIELDKNVQSSLNLGKSSLNFGNNVIPNVNNCNPSDKVMSIIGKQDVNKIDVSVNEMSTNLKTNNVCEFCNKEFRSRQGKWKHLKTCKEKKKDDECKQSMTDLVNLLNKQNEQIDKIQKELDKKNNQIDELIQKAGIQNSGTITNNIQNNIKILAYKDTDLSHLTDKDYMYCLNRSNMCIPNLIKMIHFNPKNPQNHNIYISNIKNNYIMVYDGDKWNIQNRHDLIDDLIDENESVLEQKLEDWIENGKNYPEIMKKFKRYLEKKEKDEVLNKIKQEIKFILYNNRKLIEQKIENCKN